MYMLHLLAYLINLQEANGQIGSYSIWSDEILICLGVELFLLNLDPSSFELYTVATIIQLGVTEKKKLAVSGCLVGLILVQFDWSIKLERSFMFGGTAGFVLENSVVQVRPSCRLAGFLDFCQVCGCYRVIKTTDLIMFNGWAKRE
jgi:hypothetical protein